MWANSDKHIFLWPWVLWCHCFYSETGNNMSLYSVINFFYLFILSSYPVHIKMYICNIAKWSLWWNKFVLLLYKWVYDETKYSVLLLQIQVIRQQLFYYLCIWFTLTINRWERVYTIKDKYIFFLHISPHSKFGWKHCLGKSLVLI